MTCYSHQFASRVRWFARIMNCLFATLPGTLPIGEGAMQRYSGKALALSSNFFYEFAYSDLFLKKMNSGSNQRRR